MFLIKSPVSFDPRVNLAIEEFAVRNLDIDRTYLFLYENHRSIIVGKHQNPFEEINLAFAHKNKIPFFRRISGGGSVYHDYGNLNFAFITKRTGSIFNNYRAFLQPIVDVLEKLGVKTQINLRNDLIVDQKKISGNAQFTSRDRLLCHGTLLFDVNVRDIGKVLHHPLKQILSKSTKSTRSPVTTIKNELTTKLSFVEFVDRIRKNLLKDFGWDGFFSFDEEQWQKIIDLSETKYNSWDWNFGITPTFKFLAQDNELGFKAELQISNCRIEKIEVVKPSLNINEIFLNQILKLPYSYNVLYDFFLKHTMEYSPKKLVKIFYPFNDG